VLLLTPRFNGRDGISLVSRVAADALVAHGLFVDVYSLCKEEYTDVANGVSLWNARDNPFRFVAKVAASTYDRVLTMHIHLAITAMPLVWRRAQQSVFLHGVEVWKPLRMRERLALRNASAVLANSDSTVRRFQEINSDFRELSIEVCPLGIAPLDAPVVGPSLEPGRFALIVGRLVGEARYKGHDLLLELWPAVLDQFPDFKLVIAGDGPDRTRLQEKASVPRLRESVHFTGPVSDETLQRLYRDCEFFVMPSTGEGFGLVYLEAMRARKACVGAPGAAASIIEHGRTGIIADPDCKDGLLGELLALIGQPQRTVQMGNAGYERFMENFTADHFGNKLAAALRVNHSKGATCAE
jgi:phosphatidylinositol alpha-1,6-mannosyltransferase